MLGGRRDGEAVNECSACRRDIASLSAVDKHRVGGFPQSGPADYLDRMRIGLVDPSADYDSKVHGRRCLDEDELVEAGMETDARGRWRLADEAHRVRERFAKAA
jgi:hypothetical protein